MTVFVPLAKPRAGDAVAVVSPSAGLPGLFPWVQDLGLKRLRDHFQLEPIEYPTTRQMGAPYPDRARDLMAAFADPEVKAVLTSIGGEDEIGLIPHLDPDLLAAHPKPFFGYSDNTHLHNLLWTLGIPSFYGCSTMVQLGMGGQLLDDTAASLRHALFEHGEVEITASAQFTDVNHDWADPANLDRPREMEPNDGWFWDGTADGTGQLWGGCCEALWGLLAAGRHLPADQDLDQAVFYLETSEILPDPFLVGYLLTALGERGWLQRFTAILVGRPQAWDRAKPNPPAVRAAYRQAQRQAIVAAVRAYAPAIPIVMNLDFGHTDPQLIVPSGGQARVLGSTRQVFWTY
jgi:muramoyltetrapeptide carboxypeptidase LdcA involved in peptidoglycan recycling